jgi:hypothetical protein
LDEFANTKRFVDLNRELRMSRKSDPRRGPIEHQSDSAKLHVMAVAKRDQSKMQSRR